MKKEKFLIESWASLYEEDLPDETDAKEPVDEASFSYNKKLIVVEVSEKGGHAGVIFKQDCSNEREIAPIIDDFFVEQSIEISTTTAEELSAAIVDKAGGQYKVENDDVFYYFFWI